MKKPYVHSAINPAVRDFQIKLKARKCLCQD